MSKKDLKKIKTQESALGYAIKKRKCKYESIANALFMHKTMITKYVQREKAIHRPDYIETIEKELKIPRKYWLRNDGYVKELTEQVKIDIDGYLFKKKYEELDDIIYKETGISAFEKLIIDRDIKVELFRLKNKIARIVYKMDSDVRGNDDILNRVGALSEMMDIIDEKGIANIGSIVDYLKSYEIKGMTSEEIREYEELFGKIGEDTSE